MSAKNVIDATPEIVSNRLLQIAEFIGVSKWEIGDIANFLCSMVVDHKIDASKSDVYSAVSLMLKSELAPRTIMYYAMLADFYPFPIREKYEPLPYSHFNLARSFGANKWEAVLNKAMQFLTDTGYPPTEHYLECAFSFWLDKRTDNYVNETPAPNQTVSIRSFDSNISLIQDAPKGELPPKDILTVLADFRHLTRDIFGDDAELMAAISILEDIITAKIGRWQDAGKI
jgi:hypothetical protein